MSSNKGYKQIESKFDRERTRSTDEESRGEKRSKILQLVTKQGIMNIVNDNGQRKLGPSPKWRGPPPPPACEVFVGKLPRDVFEDEIFPVFSRIGEIYQIRLLTAFSGFNRGFAFVMYTSIKHADRAVAELNNYEIRPDHRIGVAKSINNCRLSIDELPQNLDVQDFIKKIFDFTDGVKKVAVYRYRNGRIMKAFILYSAHAAAAKARRNLMRKSQLIFQGMELNVDWAYPNQYLHNVYEESGIMNENGTVEFNKILLRSQKSAQSNLKDGTSYNNEYFAHHEIDNLKNHSLENHHFEEVHNPIISTDQNGLVNCEIPLLQQVIVMLYNMLPTYLTAKLPSIEMWDSINYRNENTNSSDNLKTYRITAELYRIFLESKNSFNMLDNVHSSFL